MFIVLAVALTTVIGAAILIVVRQPQPDADRIDRFNQILDARDRDDRP